MKLRNGFVSNSSTTSFTIFGISFDPGELGIDEDATNADGELILEDLDDELYNLIDNMNDDLSIYSCYGETYYVGRSFSSIGDDETGKQFKEDAQQKVEKAIRQIAPNTTMDLTCCILSEGWRDG